MTKFADEQLSAFLDSAAEPGLAAEIKKAIGTDQEVLMRLGDMRRNDQNSSRGVRRGPWTQYHRAAFAAGCRGHRAVLSAPPHDAVMADGRRAPARASNWLDRRNAPAPNRSVNDANCIARLATERTCCALGSGARLVGCAQWRCRANGGWRTQRKTQLSFSRWQSLPPV